MNSDSVNNNPVSMLMLASSMLIFGTIGIFRRYIPLPSGLLAFARGLIGTIFLCAVMWLREMRRSSARGWGGKSRSSARKGREKSRSSTQEEGEVHHGEHCGYQPYPAENISGGISEGIPKSVSGIGRLSIPGSILALLIVSGALIGVNWILLFEAYNYTTIATATLCYYMQPIIVILLSPLFFRERLTLKKAVCTVVALAGMFFVSGAAGEGIPQGDALRGILYGLGAAVLYASVVILNKCIRGVDPYLKTVLQLGSAAVCLLPYLAVTRQFAHVEISGFSALMLLFVGLVHTGIAYTLYFGSTDGLRAQTIALFSYIDPVSALLLSMVFLHEPMTAAGVCGAVLVLGAALASELL